MHETFSLLRLQSVRVVAAQTEKKNIVFTEDMAVEPAAPSTAKKLALVWKHIQYFPKFTGKRSQTDLILQRFQSEKP